MAKMYDSTTATDIPQGVPIVAGYIDGTFRWTDADWAYHSQSDHVKIAVFASTNDGDVLDVEQGDASPASAPGWVTQRRNSGHRLPAVYCSVAALQGVRDAFTTTSIPEPVYWLADWDDDPTIPTLPGVVAKQYTHPPNSGGHYDISETSDAWPLVVQPAPTPQPHPIPQPIPQPPQVVNVNVPVLSVTSPGPNVVSAPVRNLQMLLVAHGFGVGPTGPDGRYGNNTASAVVACEHHFNLSVDSGIAGNQVWTALCNQ